MKLSPEEIKSELKVRNINLSYQRLRVLEYLVQNENHPTVEQIYTDLQKKKHINAFEDYRLQHFEDAD